VILVTVAAVTIARRVKAITIERAQELVLGCTFQSNKDFWFHSGTVASQLQLSKMLYCPGETVDAMLLIQNRSEKRAKRAIFSLLSIERWEAAYVMQPITAKSSTHSHYDSLIATLCM
jgi:hypothetical protein